MVAAMVPEVADMVANLDAPKAMLTQNEEDGRVRAVHVIPSGEVAAAVEPYAIATKELFPYAKPYQLELEGRVLDAQSIPLVDVAAMLDVPLTKAMKMPFP